jgi:hypothetical protein
VSSEKRDIKQENIIYNNILTDAVTSLIDTLKQAGYNPPISIQVDKQTFNKLLQEASELYSSINVKDSIENIEFPVRKQKIIEHIKQLHSDKSRK